MTHNKNENPLLYLLIDCISVRSVPQIFSLTDDCTFRFSNFLIVGFFSSPANCWFKIFSLLIADLFGRPSSPPEEFLSKYLWEIGARSR